VAPLWLWETVSDVIVLRTYYAANASEAGACLRWSTRGTRFVRAESEIDLAGSRRASFVSRWAGCGPGGLAKPSSGRKKVGAATGMEELVDWKTY